MANLTRSSPLRRVRVRRWMPAVPPLLRPPPPRHAVVLVPSCSHAFYRLLPLSYLQPPSYVALLLPEPQYQLVAVAVTAERGRGRGGGGGRGEWNDATAVVVTKASGSHTRYPTTRLHPLAHACCVDFGVPAHALLAPPMIPSTRLSQSV